MSDPMEQMPRLELEERPSANLELVGGRGAGSVFALSMGRITLGRGEDNHIILSSESVSRHHAFVDRSAEGEYRIFDNKSKNGVLINGEKVEAAILQHGDLVQIGEFTLRFTSQQEAIRLEENPMAVADAGSSPLAQRSRVGSSLQNKKRLIIYSAAGLLLLVLYAMNSETPAEKKEDKPTDPQLPQVDPLASTDPLKSDPLLTDAEQALSKLDWSDVSVQEAEAYFRRGQREFFNKNYHRAIDNFKASLAIYKNHPLSRYYLQVATRQAEVEAKKHFEIAARYFESLQYSRAIYHFNEVIQLLSHRPQEPIVKDASKYIDLSKRKLQAAEMFP